MRFNEVKGSFACIYRIKFPDGKYYVGQTLDFADRFRLYERSIVVRLQVILLRGVV